MTVSTQDSRFAYSGDGVTVAFSFPRKVISASDITVYLVDETTDTSTLQANPTHYTFLGSGLSNGIYATATITFVTAPTSDQQVVIFRDGDLVQETDFTAETDVQSALNRFADRDEMKLQRLSDWLSRSLRMDDGDPATSMGAMPHKALLVNKILGFDSSGNPQAVDNDTSSTIVTATGSSTARTLAARFADVGNVKDFGAVGDGTTDDTAAIEACLAVYDSVYFPKGVYRLASRLDVPAGKKLEGAGFDDTILRASATGYNGITVGNNCVLLDFTIDGNSVGGSYSGILYDGVSGCFTDRVAAINWGADGFAITNAAHHNKFGEIYATTNGSRGVLIDPNSYSNQFGSIDSRGSTNSGLLIGHNSYRNQVGLLICGGHQNSALWIHNAAYENQIGTVVVEAPATGYENNSAILLGWGALRNTIGFAIVTGWRRGLQIKGDDADPTYTDADTAYNDIGTLIVTTDNGSNAAGVSMDANNGYFAKNNRIGRLHVKNATYGIIDTSTTNYPNKFDMETATFENVTTPLSITLDIASATTTDLSTVNTEAYARITGTTTITGLGSAPMNTIRKVRFAAALTLTHNGTSLILPGSANITTAANDTAEFVSLGSGNWLCNWYKRQSGQSLAFPSPLAGAVTRGSLCTFTEYAASTTWTKPSGLIAAYVEVVGGGGGAGGGARVVLTGAPSGGGGGGGGSKAIAWFDAADLSASESITVGAAGSSGAGATSDGTGGSNGGAGGASSFGSRLQAFGGGFGSGGAVAANTGGGAGASLFEAAANASGATGGTGQHGGSNGGSATFGGNGAVSGGGGGCGSGGAGGFAGGYVTSSIGGGAGGGAGAGLAAAGTEFAGGDGGPVLGSITPPAGGAAKSAGTSPAAVGYGSGAGGGGGGSNNAGVGGAGGTGAVPGGGGGGGGCATGGNGGAGGSGGAGIVRVWAFF